MVIHFEGRLDDVLKINLKLSLAQNFEHRGDFKGAVSVMMAVNKPAKAISKVNKVVNSNMTHAAERAVERGVFPDAKTAQDRLKQWLFIRLTIKALQNSKRPESKRKTNKMTNKPIELKVSADDNEVAYLYLPDHPRQTNNKTVTKQLDIRDLVDNYAGPDLYLDFNDAGKLIGVEILARL